MRVIGLCSIIRTEQTDVWIIKASLFWSRQDTWFMGPR